jgi:putative MATE family efflux protein
LQQKTNIKNNEFYQKLLLLVLPIAFQQFMLAAVSASDAVMLGMVDQNSMSAVSLAGQVQFVFSLFLAAMTIGTSIFAAQYWGKGNKDAVERILAIVLRISVSVSFVFFIGATFFSVPIMRIFTTDKRLIAGGADYLRVVGVSYVLCSASQIYLCVMKNSGHAIKSMVISSVVVVLNIILNPVFIFGLWGAPKMGIAGSALATVIARVVELLWTILDSLKRGHIKTRMKYLLHTDKILKQDFWKYTLPVLGNELVWGCGFTMYSVIMGHLGADAVAANSIANIVKNLIACFCIGLGSGGGIMVGNQLGAGQLEKAKAYGQKLCKLSIIIGIISGAFLLALSPAILALPNLSLQANIYLKGMLVMCSYYMIGKSINGTTIAGIFCAGGDSKFGFLCDTVTLWCITVPLGLIAAFVLKLPVLAVYFIVNLDEIVKLPAVYKNYKKYNWVKDLTIKA